MRHAHDANRRRFAQECALVECRFRPRATRLRVPLLEAQLAGRPGRPGGNPSGGHGTDRKLAHAGQSRIVGAPCKARIGAKRFDLDQCRRAAGCRGRRHLVVGPTAHDAGARSAGRSIKRCCASGDSRWPVRYASYASYASYARYARYRGKQSCVARQWRARSRPGCRPHRDGCRSRACAGGLRGSTSAGCSAGNSTSSHGANLGTGSVRHKSAQAGQTANVRRAGRESTNAGPCEDETVARTRGAACCAYRRCGANIGR